MSLRNGSAERRGDIEDGLGSVTVGNGVCQGTNPEQLIAAAQVSGRRLPIGRRPRICRARRQALTTPGKYVSLNRDVSEPTLTSDGPAASSAERRLTELGIRLPEPPQPFGAYAEAVQTGNLLFLSGMLPTEGRAAKFVGRLGAEFDVEAGRKAAHLAALNALAVARRYLGSLDKVTRIVRLGVSFATAGDVRDHPKVADAASELLQDIFGEEKNPSRLIIGVASLPFGVPVALEVIFEVKGQ
jgi:enamine deaminase RidA (YjgF/YER057c/UK114 family)